ncbi:MAG: ComEC/Rec2 family competence protein [Treponema sp.]|nr:ComEC/Rec2 family competence protein [Candidatus Treponema caballi]
MVKSPAVLSAAITAFLIYSGLVSVCPRHDVRTLISEKDIVRISGTIASSPAKSSSGTSYSVLVELSEAESVHFSSAATGRIKLYIDAETVEALLPGKLYSAAVPAGSVYESVGEHDVFIAETGALISADVRFVDRVSEKAVACQIDPPQYYADTISFSGWRSRADYIRALLRLQLKRILFAWEAAGGLLLALICGAREYTEQDVSDAFRGAGLSHILALSGMHLSLFSSLTEQTAGRALGKKLQPVLTLSTSALFVWFAGASPSLVRALISMCVTACAGVACVSVNVLEKVCVSFLIHVSILPEDAGTAAFLLSYGALIGLYFGDRYVKPLISRYFPPSVAASVSASIGAQLCTAPVSILLFGECRPGGIIASVIVSPLASWFVTGGIAGLTGVLILPFLLKPVGVIMNCLYTVIRRLVMLFAGIPGIILQ